MPGQAVNGVITHQHYSVSAYLKQVCINDSRLPVIVITISNNIFAAGQQRQV